jgi:hypothetical protein
MNSNIHRWLSPRTVLFLLAVIIVLAVAYYALHQPQEVSLGDNGTASTTTSTTAMSESQNVKHPVATTKTNSTSTAIPTPMPGVFRHYNAEYDAKGLLLSLNNCYTFNTKTGKIAAISEKTVAADVPTFKPILENVASGVCFAKDRLHVFFGADALQGADPSTFTIRYSTDEKGISSLRASDKNKGYVFTKGPDSVWHLAP